MSGTQGKVVAITGASGGIGEATALLLAERGAKVVLGARRTDRLEEPCDPDRRGRGRSCPCLHGREAARRSDRTGSAGA